MTLSRLEYPLVDGFVDQWLLLGPLEETALGSEGEALHNLQPADGGAERVGDSDHIWRYWRASDDHRVVLGVPGSTSAAPSALAYTCLHSSTAQPATLTLTTNAPAEVWLRGRFLGRIASEPEPRAVTLSVDLREGDNPLLVRPRPCAGDRPPPAFAVRMKTSGSETDQGIGVRLQTVAKRPERRATLEHVAAHAYLPRRVVCRGDSISLCWAEDLDTRWRLAYLIRDERGRTYLDGTMEARPGSDLDVGHPARLWERRYDVVLRALPGEYYEDNLRYERCLGVHVLDSPYSDLPYGTYSDRRREALEDAARREGDLFAHIARMALGHWGQLEPDVLIESVAAAGRREADSDVLLLGLLGALCRYGDTEQFPRGLGQTLEEFLLSDRFGAQEAEDHSRPTNCVREPITAWACELLAGQCYPDRVFAHTGQVGTWHRQVAQERVLGWLRRRGAWGWAAWGADDMARYLFTLSHLADLAEDLDVRELSAVLMDKMLFTLAADSHRGVYGFGSGCGCTATLGSAHLEPTTPVARLLWGMGVWNHHTPTTMALACSGYELPPIIAAIAADMPETLWHRERHAGDDGHPDVHRAAYRTPDYMLSSIQDYRPGEAGGVERLWQATLGPNAVVFVNHPAAAHDWARDHPGFWRGNGVLPRVAQWHDVLLAVYRLPGDDWMGFTHAHFPIGEMDEHALLDGWAFARKGRALLALTAAGGLQLIRRGPGAYRELRSCGHTGAWLCHMGRAGANQDFVSFQSRIRQLAVEWPTLGVCCTTLRGEELSFSWDEPLLVNGQQVPPTSNRHIDSPYCVAELPATEMPIRFADTILTLDFG